MDDSNERIAGSARDSASNAKPDAGSRAGRSGGGEGRRTGIPRDILEYWSRIAGPQGIPPIGDFDHAIVDEHWPRTAILACHWEGARVQLSIVRSTIWQANASPDIDEAELNLFTDWVLSLGQVAALSARPMTRTESFSRGRTDVMIRATVLPFGADRTRVDHILCEVSRVTE